MHSSNYNAAPLPQLSESNLPIFRTHGPAKVYHLWRGNNRFFFGGRLIFGPDVRSLFMTICLIIVPAVLFCAYISKSVLCDSEHHQCVIVPATSTIFTVHIIILLFLTSGRDPGIIPRNTHPPDLEDEAENSSLPADWIAANHGMFSSIPPTKDVIVNGMVVKVKFCHTCMLYRPPRCSHCSICNNCVERFDHHCPWVGQCIGKRNYRFFFMFVSSTTLFCLYVFGLCWLNVRNIMNAYNCNLWSALHESPVSAFLIVYTFIGAWFVGGLTAFHIFLICTNQTTYENFRYKYSRKTNPHNLGVIRNLREIFLSSVPPSKINFRAKLEYSSSSVATSLSMRHRVMSPKMSARTSVDTDMDGKRHAVDAEEFEAIQNQIESVTSLERCGPQPRRNNWEIMPELDAFAAEFGMADRGKI